MLPVNFFDRPLISDAIRERQRSVRSDCRRGHTSLRSPATAGLRQREWDCADGDKCKQDKCASKNLRFDRRVNLFFHFFGLVIFELETDSPSDLRAYPSLPS
jgi:hypothetical protein